MNIEEKLKNIIKAAKNDKMLENEKSLMRFSILKHMEQNPLKKENSPIKPTNASFASLSILGQALFLFKKPIARYVLMATLVIFVSGTGVSFAANNSLPGDFLYNIKTNFNEKIYSMTIVSEEKRTDYNIYLVEKRLKEAEIMFINGRLNENSSNQIELLINRKIDKINTGFAKTNAKNKKNPPIEISSNLEATLRANSQILSDLSEDEKDKKEEISNLLININLKIKETGKIRKIEEEKMSEIRPEFTLEDAQKRLLQAEEKIDIVKKFFQTNEVVHGLLSEKYIKDNIEIAKENIVNGKVKMEEKDYSGALILFHNALRATEEIEIYFSQSEKIKTIKNNSRSNEELNNSEINKKEKSTLPNAELSQPIIDKLK